ncbi:MAG: ABC transporter permease, partial [Pseudomonadota bacterium]
MMWLVMALAAWLGGWALNAVLARRGTGRWVRVAVPVIFGLSLLLIWEGLVRGLDVSQVVLPPPSVVAQTFAASTDILWIDFQQTVLKGAVRGYVIGAVAAVLCAVLIDR